jgi:hypothetical protein
MDRAFSLRFFLRRNLGLRPRLVWVGPSALNSKYSMLTANRETR